MTEIIPSLDLNTATWRNIVERTNLVISAMTSKVATSITPLEGDIEILGDLRVLSLYLNDSKLVPIDRQIITSNGLIGGGNLTQDRTISLSQSVRDSLALADTALQPNDLDGKMMNEISISTSNGLIGGGNLTQDRTISLSQSVRDSLALADTALQPNDVSAIWEIGDVMYSARQIGEGWDLSTVIYNIFYNVAPWDTQPLGIFFKPDGTKMYMLGNANLRVNEFHLTTPWDISTTVYFSYFGISGQDAAPYGLSFSSDGTKMYMLGNVNDRVFQYKLNTPWLVTTAVLSSTFSVAAQDAATAGLYFKPDGTKMYIIGDTNKRIYEYDLTIPWDISTAIYSGKNFLYNAQDDLSRSIFFKPDGTKMYILGGVNNRIFEYDLTIPWDISTAIYSENSFHVVGQDNSPYGLSFKPDGTKMYMTGNQNDRVYEYNLDFGNDEWKACNGMGPNRPNIPLNPPLTAYIKVT